MYHEKKWVFYMAMLVERRVYAPKITTFFLTPPHLKKSSVPETPGRRPVEPSAARAKGYEFHGHRRNSRNGNTVGSLSPLSVKFGLHSQVVVFGISSINHSLQHKKQKKQCNQRICFGLFSGVLPFLTPTHFSNNNNNNNKLHNFSCQICASSERSWCFIACTATSMARGNLCTSDKHCAWRSVPPRVCTANKARRRRVVQAVTWGNC